jgi:hypothetical protein
VNRHRLTKAENEITLDPPPGLDSLKTLTRKDVWYNSVEGALGLCRKLFGRMEDANGSRGLGKLKIRMGDFDGAHEDLKAAIDLEEDIYGPMGEANLLRCRGTVKLLVSWLSAAHAPRTLAP